MTALVELSGLIAQAEHGLKAACTDGCRMHWAKKLVSLKWERGDYLDIVQVPPALVEGVKELLVAELVKQEKL